jgi:adenine-specific DNA-methyltransferase
MNTKLIRYIGSKESLISFLIESFKKHVGEINSFVEIFSGTNIVSYNISKLGVKNITSYDISSYSEALSSFVNPDISPEFIKYLKGLNDISPIEGDFFNEFSIGGSPKTISKEKFKNQEFEYRMFFSGEVGKKIDAIRTKILTDYNNNTIDESQKKIATALLLRYADSNANTTGVFGAYLKKQSKKEKPFLTKDQISDISNLKKKDINYYFKKADVLSAINDIKTPVDFIYMDPPYNTRRYETNYHILEYISNPEFNIEQIKKDSISAVPNSKIQNPFGGKQTTKQIFNEMIFEATKKCGTLFISYNNQGIMKHEDIVQICDKYNLKLETIKKDYKKYKSHNITVQGDVEEILWVIKK